MSQPIFQIDAFTDTVFKGNPAAVCLLEKGAGDDWMQNVAREMNLAETAFLERREDGFGLRWFTPGAEVDLCGHATLASAHFLWEQSHLPHDQMARFHTRSGLLTAERNGAWIVLDFPALPATPAETPDFLAGALGAEPVACCTSEFDFLVELADETAVRSLSPDHAALKAIDARGIIVTARGSGEFDFVSRFFAPRHRIDEDPVTGSAHCILTPYWAERLGRAELHARQLSARGGQLWCEDCGDRTRVGGRAVLFLEGRITLDRP